MLIGFSHICCVVRKCVVSIVWPALTSRAKSHPPQTRTSPESQGGDGFTARQYKTAANKTDVAASLFAIKPIKVEMVGKMKTEARSNERVPSDAHLVLLCLDYLMDLRENNDADVLNGEKHLDSNYINLAVFALMRTIHRPDYLSTKSSDTMFGPAFFSQINDEVTSSATSFPRHYHVNYNDLHPSNLYRFFPKNGLAGGSENGPLRLNDLVEAGLQSTNSRCRLEAEKDIVKSTQFELYMQSVTNRGFFLDPVNSQKRDDPQAEQERRARKSKVYKEKYRKAIAKYREKLAMNEETSDLQFLSPPTSPASKMSRPSYQSFRSPPRTCQLPKQRPMSPLTPNSVELEHNFSSEPQTGAKSPKSAAPPKSPSSVASFRKSSISVKPVRSNALAQVRPVTSIPAGSSSSAKAKQSTHSRPNSSLSGRSAPSTPVRTTSSSSSGYKVKESSQSQIAKMERRKAPKALRESPLDSSTCSEVKLKVKSLYEVNLASSGSSGAMESVKPTSVSSPVSRRRKSYYEIKLEEKKLWSCPTSLARSEMSGSPAKEIKPIRKGRPMSINTSQGHDTQKTSETPKGGKKADTVSELKPRSPVARLRREKMQKANKVITSRKTFGSHDDNSWISPPTGTLSSAEQSKANKSTRDTNAAFKKKASAFHANGGSKFGMNRLPANSPKGKAQLNLDPFRMNPPKFLGASKLFAATVGNDYNTEGSQQFSRRVSSPRTLGSPRSLRSSPRNFDPTPIQRAC